MQELAGSESKLHHATCNNCTNSESPFPKHEILLLIIYHFSIKDACCENKPIQARLKKKKEKKRKEKQTREFLQYAYGNDKESFTIK